VHTTTAATDIAATATIDTTAITAAAAISIKKFGSGSSYQGTNRSE